ncbi:MAG: SDR family NAD(P)-dependent oxidoreductase [Lachnospiraceae bacterium]|nr:SDR family NAD(P)-dependent oxidoreductase [Lachnospiraceae bacterium]
MSKILITGADRGLGRALSEQFLQNGHIVYAGQYMPEWKELDSLKSHYPDRLFLVPLNIGDLSSIEKAYGQVSEETDSLDILIHNAGMIGTDSRIRESVSQTDCGNVYRVNALGPLQVTQTFLPLLSREGGEQKVAFISSEAGSIALAHRRSQYAYGMSKAALNMEVRILHNTLQNMGYEFYLYHPGWMRTYMKGDKATVGDMEPEESAESAYAFFTGEAPTYLEMVDVYQRAWAF